MRKPRKNDTPSEKVAILRRHLIDRVPVSDLCDEHPLSPTLFYLEVRLHGAIGSVTPAAKLPGREPVIFAERDRKLEEAREKRKVARQASRTAV